MADKKEESTQGMRFQLMSKRKELMRMHMGGTTENDGKMMQQAARLKEEAEQHPPMTMEEAMALSLL